MRGSTPSLSGGLGRLALELVLVFGATLLTAGLMRQRRAHRDVAGVACRVVVGLLAVGLIVAQLPRAASLFHQAHRLSFSRAAAVDYCFREGLPDAADASRLAFAHSIRAITGKGAVYQLDYAPPPDPNCLFLGLLPALPAAPGERAGWSIAFGAVPATMGAEISAHGRSIRVFGPGLAVAPLAKR